MINFSLLIKFKSGNKTILSIAWIIILRNIKETSDENYLVVMKTP